MHKRILFVDILRGLAIVGVMLIHSLLFGVWYRRENALEILPSTVVYALAPFVVLATWAGLFAIISSLIYSYHVYLRLERGKSIGYSLRGPLINSTILYILHLIYKAFFTTSVKGFDGEIIYGMVTGAITLQEFVPFELQQLFIAEALSMIATVGWLTVLVLYVLWRNGGHLKHKRNFYVFLVSAIVILAVYPLIFIPLEEMYIDWYFRGVDGEYLLLLLDFIVIKPFVSGQNVLLPYASFAFIGMQYGSWIARGQDRKVIWRYTWVFSLTAFVSAVGINIYDIVIQKTPIFSLLDYRVIPYNLLWLNLSFMLLLIFGTYKYFDLVNEEVRVKRVRRWQFLRRFGTLSLTVFMFEAVIHSTFALIFHSLFGEHGAKVDDFMLNPILILIYLICLYTFWYLALKLWERYDYVGTVEWVYTKFSDRFRPDRSSKLKIKEDSYFENK